MDLFWAIVTTIIDDVVVIAAWVMDGHFSLSKQGQQFKNWSQRDDSYNVIKSIHLSESKGVIYFR